MKKSFSSYIAGYVVLFGVMLSLLLTVPKGELHVMLNGCHTAAGDVFIRLYSTLAEWPIYVIAAIPLLFKKVRWWSIMYLISELSAVLPIQILKRSFDMPRPALYFGENEIGNVLPLVEGVKLHQHHSFPSGHTSAFFVFFTTCALLLTHYYTRRASQPTAQRQAAHVLSLIGLLLLAALGGYSRIYLSQHFLLDVCVGSLVGVSIPCAVYYVLNKYNKIIPNS